MFGSGWPDVDRFLITSMYKSKINPSKFKRAMKII